jgi:hypothetical protein
MRLNTFGGNRSFVGRIIATYNNYQDQFAQEQANLESAILRNQKILNDPNASNKQKE